MSKYYEANAFLMTNLGISADPRKYHASKFRKTIAKFFPDVTRQEMDKITEEAYKKGNDMYSIISVYDDYIMELVNEEEGKSK